MAFKWLSKNVMRDGGGVLEVNDVAYRVIVVNSPNVKTRIAYELLDRDTLETGKEVARGSSFMVMVRRLEKIKPQT